MPTKLARQALRGRPRAQVLEDGTILLYGVIGSEYDQLTARQIVEGIRNLGRRDEINVLINSWGGLVDEGLAIYHELVTNPAVVTVEITGVAASMASVVAMAASEGRLRMAANAHMMVHDPWSMAIGNAEQLRRAAELLDRFGTSLVNIYASRSGLDESEIRAMMAKNDGEGTWLTAQEALDLGLIDEIVDAVEADAFAHVDTSVFRFVPAALTRQIREGRQLMDKTNGSGITAGAQPAQTPPAGAAGQAATQTAGAATATPPVSEGQLQQQIQAAVDQAIEQRNAAERERVNRIRQIADKYRLGNDWALARIAAGDSAERAQALAADELVRRQQEAGGPTDFPGGVGVSADERDKFIEGAVNWILARSGRARDIERHTGKRPDPGEFRGFRLLDLADHALQLAGVNIRGKSPMERAAMALVRSAPKAAAAGMTTSSDFPVLLENALNKMLQASYALQPVRWREIAAEGAVSDFREHKRLRKGSIGRLQEKLESGEFRHVHIDDGERGVVRAETQGVVVGITRQAIVNDDVGAFIGIMADLGQAAARSVDIDLFDLLKQNGGLGPTIGPFKVNGELESTPKSLFHTDRNNVAADSGPPTADRLEEMRVLMAKQKDPNGEDFLDLRPAVWVGPIGLGAEARVVVEAEFDFGAGTDGLFRKPNKVRDLVRAFCDTPRLEGAAWYLFADPAIAPVFEVVFLDGENAPVMEVEERIEYDGVLWRVRFDYGVAAIDYRGAVVNLGGTS